MDYQTVEFERIGGGWTMEYRTMDVVPMTLAYFDKQSGGLVAVTVFDPYKGTQRYYAPRKHVNASGILYRHLEKLGYKNRVAEKVIDSTEYDG